MSGWMIVFLMLTAFGTVLAIQPDCATPGAAKFAGVFFGLLFLVALLSRISGHTRA